jgi:type II secretory pathway component GspD/PulD (secretin)
VDKPGEPRLFKYRQLRYTMAKSLAEKVKALAEQLESVTVTVGTDTTTTPTTSAKRPGESETVYRQRVIRERARAAQQARARAASGASAEETTKPGVYLDADERTNRILMIGIGEQLAVVKDLVDALDVEQQDLRSMKLYRIRHVDAVEVRTKLEELGVVTRLPETTASTRITGGPRTTGDAAARAAAARAAAAVAAGAQATEEVSEEGPVEEPQVVVVESTNSLLVNATPEQHARIETIIGYVDSETDVSEIPYKVYPLENSSPDHLATILESLIQETTQNEDAEGKVTETVTRRREDDIAIVPDPNTYSLIVYASKKNQEWIQELIKKLDRRRPQVLIDVTLVEITKQDQFTYDLNLIESFPNLLNTSGQTDVATDVLDALLASPRDRFVDIQSNSGDFTGYYADRHVQVLLEAMQTKNYGRVLAKPKILVNDNEPGMIKTTDTTYVRKESSIPFTSGTTGQTTTSLQTAVDYAPYEAGITLDITPHISEGDLLRLDVALTRSDFLTTEDTEKPPNTTASEVATAVTVPDGSTVILGGLVKLNQNKGGKKVPILGDLPLIGGLFRGANNDDRQSKLYVFVKAEVIRPEQGLAHGMEDLEKLSERNRLAFQEHEREFQEYQSWPGIKPRPVQPERVLDAQ